MSGLERENAKDANPGPDRIPNPCRRSTNGQQCDERKNGRESWESRSLPFRRAAAPYDSPQRIQNGKRQQIPREPHVPKLETCARKKVVGEPRKSRNAEAQSAVSGKAESALAVEGWRCEETSGEEKQAHEEHGVHCDERAESAGSGSVLHRPTGGKRHVSQSGMVTNDEDREERLEVVEVGEPTGNGRRCRGDTQTYFQRGGSSDFGVHERLEVANELSERGRPARVRSSNLVRRSSHILSVHLLTATSLRRPAESKSKKTVTTRHVPSPLIFEATSLLK